MKEITAALANHFNGALTTLANAWKVTRRDGTVLGFTDHDRNQTIEGINYIASSGYFRSAIANSATTAVDNLEVQGFLDDEMISEDDLRNGLYDFAEVEIFAYNWADLSMGICRLRYGYFGEVKLRPSGLFVVELRGLLQLFSRTVGETIGPDCRADLGDERCKVSLIPRRRASGQTYALNDRVLIPDNSDVRAVNLQLQNNSFEWYTTTSYFDIWSSSGAVITNFYDPPKEDVTYYVRPIAPTGSVTRICKPVVYGVNDEDFGISWYARCEEEGWQVGALIEFLNVGGLLGTVITVLNTEEVPYQDVPFDGEWNLMSGSVNDDQVDDTYNAARITVRFRRNPHTDYDHLEGEIAKVHIAKISFYDFEDPYMHMTIPDPATRPMQVWTNNFILNLGLTHAGNINIQPIHGNAMFTRDVWAQGNSGQDVVLADIGADLALVDDSSYILDMEYLIGASEWGYTGGIVAIFKDGSDNTIGEASTGQLDLKPFGVLFTRELSAEVPPLTRKIRIELFSGLSEERDGDGSSPKVFFDYINGDLIHIDSNANDNLIQYGGVEYKATKAGTAALTQPAVTHTLGEVIIDGGVTWQAVAPEFTFMGEITAVDDNKEFYIDSIDAPDDWFKWGVLTFLSGSNQRRGVEVLSWNNTTKKMTIMLPALRPISIGDLIRVHAGCDKTRRITGCKKFNNILNFRGEPEVPGTDQYFKVGGTGR